LLDSELAGFEGGSIGGGEEKEEDVGAGSPPVFRERDNGEENSDDEEEVGDIDQEEDIVDLCKVLTKRHEDIKVETLYVPNVGLRGDSFSVRHRGLLMLSVDLPPGARLESVNITIDEKECNKGYVDVDISPSLSVPEEIFPDEWINADTGNPAIAEMFCNQLQGRNERDSVVGSMPPYRHVSEPFCWPKGQKSEMMHADPYTLNLRPVSTPAGQSFYTIKEIPLKVNEEGLTVPAFCVSVLFYSLEHEAKASISGVGMMLPPSGGGGGIQEMMVTGAQVSMEEEEVTVVSIQAVVMGIQVVMVVEGVQMAMVQGIQVDMVQGMQVVVVECLM
jgi:hypothetical protein